MSASCQFNNCFIRYLESLLLSSCGSKLNTLAPAGVFFYLKFSDVLAGFVEVL